MSRSAASPDGAAPVALVTGGARRIGAAVVEHLHRRGCDVLIHYHGSEDAAAELARRLEADRPASTRLLQADLCDREGPRHLAEAVLELTPRLALLVNNASRFYPTDFGETTGADWQDLMGGNVRGAFFLTQALLGAMAGGAVINVLDIHARRPMPGHAVYSMAKAALEMMTYALARDLAPAIRVNGVAPGAILWPEAPAVGEDRQEVLSRIALGRLGTPADIAAAVAFLGLDAPYVTGQVLAVDGGRSLNM